MPERRHIMGFVSYIKERSSALLHAVTRFPAVSVMLLGLASLTTFNIAREVSNTRWVLSFIVAVFFALAVHILIEKEGSDLLKRLLTIPAAVLAGLVFYFIAVSGISDDQTGSGPEKYLIRTLLVCSILFLLFLAFQCIRNKVVFGLVFMSAFKAFFTTLLFSGVIFGGLSLILTAIDNLLFRIDSKMYSYTATWVWILIAPIIFLSLLMTFRKDETSIERDKKISSCPAFFRVLLLYVIIPLLIIYTLVLLIYLLKTLMTGTGQELLRPLIMSYSISVIAVYFLVSEIENRLASFFRLVFPKIMAAIALYQVIVSVLAISKSGVDFGEYFIILISVYAVVSGILMSVFKAEKNVILVLVLCGFAVFALLPFVNFYNVSVTSQKSVLVNVLERNDMLTDGEIIGKSSVPQEDRKLITRTYGFLESQEELDQISGIKKASLSKSFSELFGFDPDYGYGGMTQYREPAVLSVSMNQAFIVSGSDYLIPVKYIEVERGKTSDTFLSSFAHNGVTYSLSARTGENTFDFAISNASDGIVLTAPFSQYTDKLRNTEFSGKNNVPTEQMTYEYSEGDISITVYITTIYLYPEDAPGLAFSVEPIILVDFV